MIIDLPDTTVSAISKKLVSVREEGGAVALGRVLTLIIVTHEIGFAREVADRVVFLDQGRVVEQGTPDEVLTRPQHPRTQEFLAKVLG